MVVAPLGSPWVRLLTFLHHGDPPKGASPFRTWLAETTVHQTSVAFHAVGALLVAGGLIAVMVMRWWGTAELEGLRWKGRDRWLRFAVLGGWALNGVGGIMRLYEPDHPGIQGVSDTAWVQVLFVKHIALLGAVWLSLLAIDMGPRRWTVDPPQKAFFAFVLVIFSAVLGGVSTGVTLPDVAGGADDLQQRGGDNETLLRRVYTNSTVTVTGTPLASDTQEVPFHVPVQGTEVLVAVSWTNDRMELTGRLVDPAGTIVDERTRGNDPLRPTTTMELSALADDVKPGQWKVVLVAQRAVRETVSVSIQVVESSLGLRVLEDTVTIRADGIGELNFYMDPGDWFNYTFHVKQGDPAVEWDIHSHPDEATVNTHRSGSATHAEGNFTAGPDGIYSILWVAPQDKAVTLTYRVAGVYRVHSTVIQS